MNRGRLIEKRGSRLAWVVPGALLLSFYALPQAQATVMPDALAKGAREQPAVKVVPQVTIPGGGSNGVDGFGQPVIVQEQEGGDQNSVPVPGTLLLMGLGLAALTRARRR